MFSCICPFVGQEMWARLGHEELLTYVAWPKCDEAKLVKDEVKIPVSVNGKTRNVLLLPADSSEEEVKAAALNDERVKPFLEGKEIKKVIYVKGRILNIVVA